jgi:ADP-ribose pyrophosphatase YjhB (NUDIX family)
MKFNCPCYGVIVRNGEVLLLKRKEPPVWEFPGGKIEREESLRDAIRREVAEEAGLKVEPGLLMPVREAEDVVAVFGLCDYKGDKVVTEELREHRWVPLKSMPPSIDGTALARSVKVFLKEIGHY